jgi:hypothetical protein
VSYSQKATVDHDRQISSDGRFDQRELEKEGVDHKKKDVSKITKQKEEQMIKKGQKVDDGFETVNANDNDDRTTEETEFEKTLAPGMEKLFGVTVRTGRLPKYRSEKVQVQFTAGHKSVPQQNISASDTQSEKKINVYQTAMEQDKNTRPPNESQTKPSPGTPKDSTPPATYQPRHPSVQFKDIPLDTSEGTQVHIERLQFELSVKAGEEIDVRTQALVVLGKRIHVDPSRKVMPYFTSDSDLHPILTNHYDVPTELEAMKVYLAHPQHNPRTRKVVFYTKFTTITSISALKQDTSYFT